jgi:hypothetical protein
MYPPKWRKNLAAVTLYLRCPKCRFSVELDGHGKAKCSFCGYEININRHN